MHFDDTDDEQTTDIPAETMAQLVFGATDQPKGDE